MQKHPRHDAERLRAALIDVDLTRTWRIIPSRFADRPLRTGMGRAYVADRLGSLGKMGSHRVRRQQASDDFMAGASSA